jgi:hypothetical protein
MHHDTLLHHSGLGGAEPGMQRSGYVGGQMRPQAGSLGGKDPSSTGSKTR